MTKNVSIDDSLAAGIVERLESLIHDAEAQRKPLEVDPYRGQLFELFVTAEGAGYLNQEGPKNLTADGICHILAERWDLADAARQSFEQQAKLPPEHLAKMRTLWAVMRMWMEWTYAWQRWDEFHGGQKEG